MALSYTSFASSPAVMFSPVVLRWASSTRRCEAGSPPGVSVGDCCDTFCVHVRALAHACCTRRRHPDLIRAQPMERESICPPPGPPDTCKLRKAVRKSSSVGQRIICVTVPTVEPTGRGVGYVDSNCSIVCFGIERYRTSSGSRTCL